MRATSAEDGRGGGPEEAKDGEAEATAAEADEVAGVSVGGAAEAALAD